MTFSLQYLVFLATYPSHVFFVFLYHQLVESAHVGPEFPAGWAVGAGSGVAVGAGSGVAVGAGSGVEGADVGSNVGVSLGVDVGVAEGTAVVGVAVGVSLGLAVGTAVGSGVLVPVISNTYAEPES